MRTSLHLMILSLCLLLGLGNSAPPRTTLATDSEAQWIAFDMTPGNQIRFTMTINDRPATAVLDTGVNISVMSRSFAKAAGITAVSRSQADAIGGTIDIAWATTRSVAIGGLTRTGGRMALVDLAPIATGGGPPVDVLVGADLLSCCALEIDYDARRLRLLKSGRMPFQGTSVPLTLIRGSGVYGSELTVGGMRIRPVIVDTGDGSTMTLSRAAWTTTGLRTVRGTSAIGYGLGGAIETDLTIMPEVRVATLIARQVELRIERDDGFATRTGTAGRIGTGFLQRYRVLLDPSAGHMVLAPGASANRMPVRSTSGLLLAYDTGRLRVLHVMKNGPAASSGWNEGDLICRVDGSPVRYASGAVDTSWAIGAPGRVVRLGMCDGTIRALSLTRFY